MCSLCKQEILPPCDLDFIGDVSNRGGGEKKRRREWRREGEKACSFRSSRLTNGADAHLCPAPFAFFPPPSLFFFFFLLPVPLPLFLPGSTSSPRGMQSHVRLRASRTPILYTHSRIHRFRSPPPPPPAFHLLSRAIVREEKYFNAPIIFTTSRS